MRNPMISMELKRKGNIKQKNKTKTKKIQNNEAQIVMHSDCDMQVEHKILI